MIIGYADRTVRIFNWVNSNNNNNSTINSTIQANSTNYPIQELGKFVLSSSWELPDQVNSISKIFL